SIRRPLGPQRTALDWNPGALGKLDRGCHAGAFAVVDVNDHRVRDRKPRQPGGDAEGALRWLVVGEDAGLREPEVRRDRGVAALEAIAQAMAGVGNVTLDVAGERGFEDDAPHRVTSRGCLMAIMAPPVGRRGRVSTARWPLRVRGRTFRRSGLRR